MKERHSIYIRRHVEKRSPPWTADNILQQYKFTNVYRELDRVTIWVRQNIREPYADHPNLWFMLCAARQINWPLTLAELMSKGAWPTGDRWNAAKARRVMLARHARGDKLYTSAYMLTTQGRGASAPKDKAFYTCHLVLGSVWRARSQILAALEEGTLTAVHQALLPCTGWGGFTAYEVVTDLRHTRYLRNAPDINRWAFVGPGAVRGLNRIANRDLRSRLNPLKALGELRRLHERLSGVWSTGEHWPALELREIEHSCCEFDKYERVRLGEGKTKSKFDCYAAAARDRSV